MFFKFLLMPFTWFFDGIAIIIEIVIGAIIAFFDGLAVIFKLLYDIIEALIRGITIVTVTIYRIIKGVILFISGAFKKQPKENKVQVANADLKSKAVRVAKPKRTHDVNNAKPFINIVVSVMKTIFGWVNAIFIFIGKIIKYIFKGMLVVIELPYFLALDLVIIWMKGIAFVVFIAFRMLILFGILLSRVIRYSLLALSFMLMSFGKGFAKGMERTASKTAKSTGELKKRLFIIFKNVYKLLSFSYKGFVFTISKSVLGIILFFIYNFKAIRYIFKQMFKPFKKLAELPAKMNASMAEAKAKAVAKKEEREERLERKKELKRKIKEASKSPFVAFLDTLRYAPKRMQVALVKWYENLSFVKDKKNQLELKRQQLEINFEESSEVRSSKKIVFKYIAKNPNGRIEKGKLSAYSKLDVHSYLLAEGYEVYEIDIFKGISIKGERKSRIKSSDLVFFLTQLSTYIRAGIPLVDSMKILEKQAKNPKLIALYKGIIYDLTMGDSFSQGLENQGEAFPKLLVNMIKAAELAGNLTETLDDMGDYYTAINKTKKAMISAMTYPISISGFAILVVVFILVWVIPNFVDMYREMDAALPTITVITITMSDFLQKYWVFLGIGFAALVFVIGALYANVKVFRTLIQWISMRLPIIGKIIIYNEVTMFSKTFSSLWKHNVFITDSMEVLGRITNNEIYKMLIFDAIANVAKGESISISFKDQWAFPLVAYEMLVTGERTGQPGEMMEKVADFYQEEHRNAVNSIKTFIEPVMIIFLAVVVGGILLSVILPMFTLYGNIAG